MRPRRPAGTARHLAALAAALLVGAVGWLSSSLAAQPRPMPLITFQRQHGSRGAVVARLVADRLGYTCWDRELVAAIATHLQVDAAELALEQIEHDEDLNTP